MQPRTDLSLFQFTEIGFRRIQAFIDQIGIGFEIVLAGNPRPIQLLKRDQNSTFKDLTAIGSELTCVDEFVELTLQALQWTVQPSSPQRRGEVIQHNGVPPSFRL
jgi:hypothetical protein